VRVVSPPTEAFLDPFDPVCGLAAVAVPGLLVAAVAPSREALARTPLATVLALALIRGALSLSMALAVVLAWVLPALM
jgi:hypothetical protein